MQHKATVVLCRVQTCSGTNGLSRLIPERRKSNDTISRHATPHVNLLCIYLLFNNSLRWSTTPNSAVMAVHDTIKIECSIIKKRHRLQEKLIDVKSLQLFLTKPLFYSHGRLVLCIAAIANFTHVNVGLCTTS
jgi:hypothetical protein